MDRFGGNEACRWKTSASNFFFFILCVCASHIFPSFNFIVFRIFCICIYIFCKFRVWSIQSAWIKMYAFVCVMCVRVYDFSAVEIWRNIICVNAMKTWFLYSGIYTLFAHFNGAVSTSDNSFVFNLFVCFPFCPIHWYAIWRSLHRLHPHIFIHLYYIFFQWYHFFGCITIIIIWSACIEDIAIFPFISSQDSISLSHLQRYLYLFII